jgi:L-fuculose-phosphate aldolase
MTADHELRAAVLDAARGMNRHGINRGTSGNVSARVDPGMLITPSAVPYDRVRAEDLVTMGLDGSGAVPPGVRPSTEWRLHAAVYAARPDVGAVLHAHPMYATALACLRRGIPAFHYMVAVAGGSEIRCSAYATYGTAELAAATVEALGPRNACLLANHGFVTCAATPAEALAVALEVEALAGQYLCALQVGAPVLLDEAEMKRVREAFRQYRGAAREGD